MHKSPHLLDDGHEAHSYLSSYRELCSGVQISLLLSAQQGARVTMRLVVNSTAPVSCPGVQAAPPGCCLGL